VQGGFHNSSNPAALKTLRRLITSSSVQVHGFHGSCSDIDAIVHWGSIWNSKVIFYQTTLIRLLLLRSKNLNVSLISLCDSTNRRL
jgi:hypothetical protein